MTPEIDFDSIDEDEEGHYLFSSLRPDEKFRVTNLIDRNGDDTEDLEEALGGVVKIHETCFMVFTFPTVQ